ncbi:MAG: phosphatase PAP2 family protein [candidate division Zixibacteria bacterium]|nr:phosphatase PAP2 family protein [candidate division Zixibacteria bacterium]
MLENLDLTILYFFNHDLTNPVLDWLFLIISESRIFQAIVFLIFTILIWKGPIRLRLALILIVICVAIVDPSTHYILKNLFARLRPCHNLDNIRLLVGCGGQYGFPSNHTVNIFALATILTLFYRRYLAVFASVALLMGLSRIYLGKHYPSDVLAGAIFGLAAAIIFIYIAGYLLKRLPITQRWSKFMPDIQGALIWNKTRLK